MNRQVKVFVSSAFQGMWDERNVLATHVFPEIKKRCKERKVIFTEIDLRWGATTEDKKDTAISVCLHRLSESTHFLGCLGEKYGKSLTDKQVAAVSDEYPWVKDYQDRSATELEVLHALYDMNSGTVRDDMSALFYFRDPDYVDFVDEKERKFYVEKDNVVKQGNLKQQVRDLNCSIADYQKPDDLKELVVEQLWALIDKQFPEDSIPTEREREDWEHEAFALSRQRVYIPQSDNLARLTEHFLSDETKPLVVTGESGIGKSALLANWALDYRDKHPDELVFWHFCGSSPASSDSIAMLRRLLEFLKVNFQIDEEVPSTADAVVKLLPDWLKKVHRKIVVILDGLNQLENNDWTWLPQFIPQNVRLFVSTLGELPVAAVELEVKLLSEDDQHILIEQYLARYGRKLEPDYLHRLVIAPQTANPLYLMVILEELRLFGIYHELGNELNKYLAAATIPDLYQLVLKRLKRTYSVDDHPNLVNDALGLLWAARRGLQESELLVLLKVSQAVWSPLYLALELGLVNRAGTLNFFHDYLRQAVERNIEYKNKLHLQLADFFAGLPLDSRQADELPYQLSLAGDLERLRACISEIPMFVQLIQDGKMYEILGYWYKLGKQNYEIVKIYLHELIEYEKNVFYGDLSLALNEIVFFCLHIGIYTEAVIFLAYRLLETKEYILDSQHPKIATSLNNLALLLHKKGNYEQAEPLFRQALEIRKQVLGLKHHDTIQSLNNLGLLFYEKGDYKQAKSLYLQALEIYEQTSGLQNSNAAIYLNNLGLLFYAESDYEQAEPLFRQALKINELFLGLQHPNTSTSLNSLAGLLQEKGEYEQAESLYRQSLKIRKQVLGLQHPDTAISLNNLASLLEEKGEYEQAESLYQQALEIVEKVLGPEHPHTILCRKNLENILAEKDEKEN